MEWVVTTGKTIEEAKELALDRLGVAADDAEFEVLDEARTGLFGRVKSEAKLRARVKPTQVRPKQDRRRRGKEPRDQSGARTTDDADETGTSRSPDASRRKGAAAGSSSGSKNGQAGGDRQRSKRQRQDKEQAVMNGEVQNRDEVTPEAVGEAAVTFMDGLAAAFGVSATSELEIAEGELDVRLVGDGLGLLVGPGGRTLAAVQDLARVASQRRLGDHDTRLRIDVGGYREKRRAALERFALAVANEVVDQGEAKALEPMSSADRKAVHDAIAAIEGVTSRSEGDDPNRRVVISPA